MGHHTGVILFVVLVTAAGSLILEGMISDHMPTWIDFGSVYGKDELQFPAALQEIITLLHDQKAYVTLEYEKQRYNCWQYEKQLVHWFLLVQPKGITQKSCIASYKEWGPLEVMQ